MSNPWRDPVTLPTGTGFLHVVTGVKDTVASLVTVPDIEASGTPGASNYLRGDGSWQTPQSGGSPPTGTGFRHVTSGSEDAASKLVDTADINASQVTYAKIQNISAQNRLLGRKSSGVGSIEELTPTELTALLDLFSTLKGLVPASSGGTTTFLRADGTWAAPGGGSDPWTYLRLASDFTTTSATAVDITGLAFTPSANTRYEFEAVLMLRTATATVNPRTGLAWATGGTDGVANIQTAQSATAQILTFGNINAALLAAVGGLPNTTQSWPAYIWGYFIAGASPSGTVKLQLASETAGTTVRAVAGSWLKWRTVP